MKHLPIHPLTLQSIKKGHPWITKDKYSTNFPKSDQLIKIHDPGSKHLLGTFLHDPTHPKVVARFWSHTDGDFESQLKSKLKAAIDLRKNVLNKRENVYLTFGEADGLPGLFIQKLNNSILIQFHCFTWEKHVDRIVSYFKTKKELNDVNQYWTQKRIPGEGKKAPVAYTKENDPTAVVSEGNIKFNVRYNLNHDIGLYTDMSAIREKLAPHFDNSKSVLNLFSYTGAFSLMALKRKSQTTSVDLSRVYMDWLEDNIKLNELDLEIHQSMVMPSERAIKKLTQDEKDFDLIICDPPSFFSDKKKRINSKDFYKENLISILSLLSDHGKAVIMINTHQLSQRQFKTLIQEVMQKNGKFKVIEEYMMAEDCKPLPKFSEGNYLKCLVIARK